MPADDSSAAAADVRESIIQNAKDTASRFSLPLEGVIKEYETALTHSTSSVFEHAHREAELGEMERKVLAGLSAIPLEPNADAVAKMTGEVGAAVSLLQTLGQLYGDEAQAVAQNITAKALEGDGLQTLIARHQELADQEARLEQATAMYAKLIPRIPVHATVNQMLKFNEAVANLTRQASEALGLNPETAKLFQQKLETKAHHFDFRGSHFNIHQAYEGMDPERVAVAFANDLPALGERRVQSSFAPLFGV